MSIIYGAFNKEYPHADSGSDSAGVGEAARDTGGSVAPKTNALVERRDLWASAPQIASADGIDVLVDGRLRFDRDATVNVDTAAAARLILQAYRQGRVGAELFADIYGSFAVVIVDAERGRVMMGIDRMGSKSLSYATAAGGTLVFGTSPGHVARHRDIRAGLSNQALFDYVHLYVVPSPTTVFENVRKLAPGRVAIFERGAVTTERYWRPVFADRTDRSETDLAATLHETLSASVARCEPGEHAGTFLSGGLDSSAVLGKLSDTTGSPVDAYSVGFDAEGFDELYYARLAVDQFDARHHEISLTPEQIPPVIPEIAAAYPEPFGNASAVPALFCARLARSSGTTHMLAGDGGDELFAGNGHYTRMQVFEHYRRLPDWLRRGTLEKWVPALIAEDAMFPFGKIRSYVQQARIPLPERIHSWNYMFRNPASGVFSGEFLGSVDESFPTAAMSAVYEESGTRGVLNKMLYFDWKYTLADNDLRKVNGMCDLAGVEVSYPMLDDALVEFSLTIPASMKIRGRKLRHLFKVAMRDYLPAEIIDKPKQGFGLPFGVWLKTSDQLQALLRDSFAALDRRAIFAPGFLDRLIAQHREGSASYHGPLLWNLLMLEHWLQANEEVA